MGTVKKRHADLRQPAGVWHIPLTDAVEFDLSYNLVDNFPDPYPALVVSDFIRGALDTGPA